MNWIDVYYIEFYRKWLEIHWFLNDPLWCLPAYSINERKEPLWDWIASIACSTSCPSQSLSTSYDHQPLDPSNSSARNFVVTTWPFLSICNPSLVGHLHVAVSELEHEDSLDVGEVKICWRVLRPNNLCMHYKYLAPSISEVNGILKILTVTVHLRDYNNWTLWEDALKIYLHFFLHTHLSFWHTVIFHICFTSRSTETHWIVNCIFSQKYL